jgi:importin subunit beta-1
MKSALGVLGDLADTLRSHIGPLISQSSSSKDLIEECMVYDDPLVRESAQWAKLAINRAVSG